MKIRSNYVSNSSSSSFVIACKNEQIAEQVINAYNKLVEYWKEIHPTCDLTYFNDYYSQDSVDNILNSFSRYFGFTEFEYRHLLNSWKEKENNGYVFLTGSCSNEVDMNGYMIMNIFNEWILDTLKDDNDKHLDVEVVFNRRGS